MSEPSSTLFPPKPISLAVPESPGHKSDHSGSPSILSVHGMRRDETVRKINASSMRQLETSADASLRRLKQKKQMNQKKKEEQEQIKHGCCSVC